ncbi:MAG: hypothetical protein RJA36_310 [Pseudomonadota bacterium]|jgi:hypothetical protein
MAKVKQWTGGGKRGLHLWCPGCDAVHGVTTDPLGWTWNGDVEKPTLSPSLLTNAGKAHSTAPICHCFVRDGRIEFLSDSTHALAGQTVDLPPWPYGDQ